MKYIISIILSLLIFSGISQEKFTISGYIKDAESGEDLIGATVLVKELGTGTVANIYGFYSITLPKGTYNIVYSFVGYNSVSKTIELTSDVKVNIELGTNSETLKEFEVVGEQENKNVESVQMSVQKMEMNVVKKIPALMGEVDIIKAIQLLPGVQSGGEGSTGFFVRGGAADQNLILLDEAPVYNASHLFGFFSVFNADAIKNAQLYKGGIPSQYGGRLSSVLDVRMKEGNMKKLSVSGGIGVISSKLTVEAPIVKDKASFIVSGRRTYGDLFLNFSKKETLKKSQLYFYDLNGKVNAKINENNRLYLSAYTGRDILGIGGLFGMAWGNKTITTRWNHLFSDKLFSNLTLIYSNFDYNINAPDSTGFDWDSNIKNYSIKNDYTFYLNPKNTIRFGIISTFNKFLPAKFTPTEENESFDEMKFPDRYALESAAYISNETRFAARLSAEYGVRFSMFHNIGVDTLFNFDENYDTTGYTAYAKGDFYNQYSGLEPRIGIKYTLTDESSLKASYNRMFQYLHLASNSTSGTPLDVWVPSSPNILPQIADQVALGYFRNFKNNMFETSVEGYYKKMQNQVDFKDNAQIIFNRLLDGEMRQGNAYSYGLEFFLKKSKGDFTGWISYTASKTRRTIPTVNQDKEFPANYDRPHNLSVVLSYQIHPRLNLSTNWVYYTGLPFTPPAQGFDYNNVYVPVYPSRNYKRIPDYHRLDLSATWDLQKKFNDKYEHSLNFSVYNAYARKNTFSITTGKNSETGRPEATKTYLFSIIPAITYSFKF